MAADDADPKAGEPWALLVGCEQYHRANKLRHTVSDADQLAGTLHAWGGYGKDHILEMSDRADNERLKPLKTNLQAELPRFLRKPGPGDVLIVYFSGHGFRDAEGKMFLAPLDVDPEKPAETGIPVEWFRRQIAACPAAFKLLIIDACHAGSEKGDDKAAGVPSKDLGELYKDLDKVVTLASSTADQKSQIWEDKQQSLFSYWLNQGLRGHANYDGDGAVDIDELYKYVSRTVSQTAERRLLAAANVRADRALRSARRAGAGPLAAAAAQERAGRHGGANGRRPGRSQSHGGRLGADHRIGMGHVRP